MKPRPGDVFFVGPTASVQFSPPSAIVVRIIRVDPRPTYLELIWLDCYVLAGVGGEAVDRRQIFVQLAGLRTVDDGRG